MYYFSFTQLSLWHQEDRYNVVIPPEYVEEYTKVPECPIDRLEMLISFDAPSLAKLLPEYSFIVSEMREVRYIYDTHKSKDTLDYYFFGVTFPRVAQRDALSAKGASQTRSMLTLFPGKGSEIALPSASRRVRKDAFKPDS